MWVRNLLQPQHTPFAPGLLNRVFFSVDENRPTARTVRPPTTQRQTQRRSHLPPGSQNENGNDSSEMTGGTEGFWMCLESLGPCNSARWGVLPRLPVASCPHLRVTVRHTVAALPAVARTPMSCCGDLWAGNMAGICCAMSECMREVVAPAPHVMCMNWVLASVRSQQTAQRDYSCVRVLAAERYASA